MLRALRVLRVLRLITALPSLKRVVAGLLAALPGMGSIVLLIGLIYYVFAVMATKMFGDAKPELFGTLGDSLFTLFTVMTLEGWVDGVTKPVMETYPWAWIFFIIFIVFTTFMVLNLFIGVVVNAMQAEAEKGMAAERAAEREIVHGEAEPILAEVRRLRSDLADLRKELSGRHGRCGLAPSPFVPAPPITSGVNSSGDPARKASRTSRLRGNERSTRSDISPTYVRKCFESLSPCAW